METCDDHSPNSTTRIRWQEGQKCRRLQEKDGRGLSCTAIRLVWLVDQPSLGLCAEGVGFLDICVDDMEGTPFSGAAQFGNNVIVHTATPRILSIRRSCAAAAQDRHPEGH
jgi:hypothetical protein